MIQTIFTLEAKIVLFTKEKFIQKTDRILLKIDSQDIEELLWLLIFIHQSKKEIQTLKI